MGAAESGFLFSALVPYKSRSAIRWLISALPPKADQLAAPRRVRQRCQSLDASAVIRLDRPNNADAGSAAVAVGVSRRGARRESKFFLNDTIHRFISKTL
jgi:hypothetical protein